MLKYSLLIFSILIGRLNAAGQPGQLKASCQAINQLNTAVTNGTIAKPIAAQGFKVLIERIKANSPVGNKTAVWTFPLAGYNHRAIGGTQGSGYTTAGYNYFDGNKHKAHPAHDILYQTATRTAWMTVPNARLMFWP